MTVWRDGRQLLIDGLDRLVRASCPSRCPRIDALATHAPLIEKEDARLDWQQCRDAGPQVRAYNPWPVAFGEIEGVQCRIFAAECRTRA
jgi:methionyl-tRNA formyltransferase